MRGFILGLLFALLAIPAGVFLWLRLGNPPVAVADASLPFEKQIAGMALHHRVHEQMPRQAALSPTSANLLLGAETYREQCAVCHGGYGRPSEIAPHMWPHPPQLWAPHGHGIVGVSDDPAGETYWKVKNGIRLSGMPSYDHTLNETQMWQISVLLANADKPLPENVLAVLKEPIAVETHPSGASPSAPPVEIPVQPLPQQ